MPVYVSTIQVGIMIGSKKAIEGGGGRGHVV